MRRAGLVPQPHPWLGHLVVCLDSWEWAKPWNRVVITSDSDPAVLDLSLAAGLCVVLAHRDDVVPERLYTLIRRLLHDVCVATLRTVCMGDHERNEIIKSFELGIERTRYM
jgi:hypothetical protein